jgi:hypothetical protein
LDQPAAAATPPPTDQRECPQCHRSEVASAKFCRYCGTSFAAEKTTAAASETGADNPPATSPVVAPRLQQSTPPSAATADRATVVRPADPPPQAAPDVKSGLPPSRALALVASVVLVLGGAGAAAWYLLAPHGSSSPAAPAAPDQAFLESRVSSALPQFVKLTDFRIESSADNSGTRGDPVVTARFRGNLLFTADTFASSSVEDDAVIVTPRFKQGSAREISGTATSRPTGATWNSEISFDQNPLADLGTPRESIQAHRVIIAGSPEEAAFREEQSHQKSAVTQVAEAAPPQVHEPPVAPPAPAVRSQQSVPPPRQTTAATPVAAPPPPAPAAETQVPRAPQAAPPSPPVQSPAPAPTAAPPQTAANPPRPEPVQPAAISQGDRTPPAEPVRIVPVPVGTEIEVRLSSGLNSGKSAVEDRFDATTVAPVSIGGRTVVPAGSVMRGVVSSVQPATRTNRTSRMTLNFEQITVNGRAYPMRGTLNRVISGPGLKGDATRAGAGAAVGAVIGGILGGAKGAIAGLLVGGGGVLAATEGKEIDVPAGTVLRVRVDAPIEIQ